MALLLLLILATCQTILCRSVAWVKEEPLLDPVDDANCAIVDNDLYMIAGLG